MKKMKISELTRLEAPIFFSIGILIGVLASWIYLITADIPLYLKICSSIGELCIMGMIIFGMIEAIKARKNYLTMMNEMTPNADSDMMKATINNIINNPPKVEDELK
jgi:uncharacterized protein YacL